MAGASPALAMTPRAVIPGWSPSAPPTDPAALAESLAEITYAVSCGSVVTTGWSGEVADDTVEDVAALIVTTSAVPGACAGLPGALVVRQGDARVEARPAIHNAPAGLGSIFVAEDLPYADWDFVPMPRVGQWVGLSARTPTGEALPLIERRVATVGDGTFTLDSRVEAAYVGAPVVDNTGRALGTMVSAGVIVTGSPQFCDVIFICVDPSQVWRDITAPSAVTNAKATAGKGKVTFTWKAAADDGGAEAAYWYRVGAGQWKQADVFRVTVKARKGQRVTIALGTVNDAGPGPTLILSAKAK